MHDVVHMSSAPQNMLSRQNALLPELKRSVTAYADVPFISTLCDIMSVRSCTPFLTKHAKNNCDWMSVAAYIRLYEDLLCFYHEFEKNILNLYYKVGGKAVIEPRQPPKELMSWMMASVMRNPRLRHHWFTSDMKRRQKKKTKKKRVHISYTAFSDALKIEY